MAVESVSRDGRNSNARHRAEKTPLRRAKILQNNVFHAQRRELMTVESVSRDGRNSNARHRAEKTPLRHVKLLQINVFHAQRRELMTVESVSRDGRNSNARHRAVKTPLRPVKTPLRRGKLLQINVFHAMRRELMTVKSVSRDGRNPNARHRAVKTPLRRESFVANRVTRSREAVEVPLHPAHQLRDIHCFDHRRGAIYKVVVSDFQRGGKTLSNHVKLLQNNVFHAQRRELMTVESVSRDGRNPNARHRAEKTPLHHAHRFRDIHCFDRRRVAIYKVVVSDFQRGGKTLTNRAKLLKTNVFHAQRRELMTVKSVSRDGRNSNARHRAGKTPLRHAHRFRDIHCFDRRRVAIYKVVVSDFQRGGKTLTNRAKLLKTNVFHAQRRELMAVESVSRDGRNPNARHRAEKTPLRHVKLLQNNVFHAQRRELMTVESVSRDGRNPNARHRAVKVLRTRESFVANRVTRSREAGKVPLHHGKLF